MPLALGGDMGTNKRFYWLKLHKDFFNNKEMKKLRSIAGGDTYTIIYLKLQLLTLNTEGRLIYDGIEDTFAKELALEINEDAENVAITLNFLRKAGLLIECSPDEYLLPETENNLGSETQGAERVRKHRESKKALQCNTLVINGNTEKEIEKEIEKELELEIDNTPLPPLEKPKKSKKDHQPNTPTELKIKFAEFVAMTNDEYQSLIANEQLGCEAAVKRCIEILDNYKGSKGQKYKSDYRAILSWVIDRYKEEQQRRAVKTQTNSNDGLFAKIARGEIKLD